MGYSTGMSVTEPTPVETGESPPAELVEVGVYPNAGDGFEHGLVVLALGWPYWLMPVAQGFSLLVEPTAGESVREQLARYDRESIGWPPRPREEEAPRHDAGGFTLLLWALVLLASFWAQGFWPGWTEYGALDAAAVWQRGEFWRPFTALFLHADAGHLVANVLTGLGVFAAVISTMGRRRGWAAIAGAAVGGNLMAAAVNYAGTYRSIGASTAVFAALGLLTGRAIRRALNAEHPHRWRGMFVPLAAGVTVLGLYGAGGVEIDVLAHTTGFLAGAALGFALGEATS